MSPGRLDARIGMVEDGSEMNLIGDLEDQLAHCLP